MATTKRNGRIFIYEGYMFTRTSQRSKHGEEIWTCKNRSQCKVRIRTTGDGFILVEDFLLWDSGAGPDRILLFGAQHNLCRLRDTPSIQCDGTFLLAPTPLFEQIYVIHGKLFGALHPLLYALLSDKSGPTYCHNRT